jgi:hypothetical protein
MKNRMTKELKQAVLDEELREKKREVSLLSPLQSSPELALLTVGSNERNSKSKFEACQGVMEETQRGEGARQTVYSAAAV